LALLTQLLLVLEVRQQHLKSQVLMVLILFLVPSRHLAAAEVAPTTLVLEQAVVVDLVVAVRQPVWQVVQLVLEHLAKVLLAVLD
jgi:hypothetical protein